ncbi:MULTISPECIES: tRNA (cytidine(34)-2'-O)-methyltransferase [unclassified Prochlorococcus]|uniref:tRNA (cytidine(34)-2'-O)-methyltransferase n=1 Tax=unclassified Prochlorococcus TaxID=2627481 RepID=UPI000533B075|nr:MULTISPECIES: tRNA (cytidine(34)-2'-O)-methyltransferase [unclassified Prochlorococcus]KGG15296.1 tRNA (cytosine34-2'-O-)-methyltransferase [Prochlorococcus sp. MIT 0602]KGG17574.1 tRNA (cytosine34-2'-O-)-methyltransferase [Prochlorococcus sp. MIT 0603]
MNNFRVGLFEPRIPQNTGNIGRTCLAFNLKLDLIYPLGFDLNDKYLKRAGLDYWQHLDVTTHINFQSYSNFIKGSRIIGFSKKGGIDLKEFHFSNNDCLLFGREDLGLPNNIREQCDSICSINMPGISTLSNTSGVRSLNLSVACGIAVYSAYNS